MQVQLIDIEHRTLKTESMFGIFGRDASGKLWEIGIYGLIFEFYVKAFHYPGSVERIIYELNEVLGAAHHTVAAPIKYIFKTKKLNLYGYSEDTFEVFCIGLTAFKCIGPTLDYLHRICTGVNLEIFNEIIDPIIYFMNKLEIQSWVNITQISGNNTAHVDHLTAIPLAVETSIAPLTTISIDIECISESGGFPNADTDPIILIAAIVNNSLSNEHRLQKHVFASQSVGNGANDSLNGSSLSNQITYNSFTSESGMLSAWSAFVIDIDPDIITGYNIQSFDLPYILRRMQVLDIRESCRFARGKNL